ncbi:MAG: hypothetical protein J6D52_09220 [Clostridia bacterium]|nr:hypothetical protein [Clostridia bacterium]
MSIFCCDRRCECISLAVIVSLLIGVVTAFLTFAAVVALTPAFLWVVLGIAVVYLALTLVTAPFIQCADRRCICSALNTLLVAVLGTIFLAILLLAVTFAATSIIGAILTGLLLFFLFLVLTATACLVKCIVGCNN